MADSGVGSGDTTSIGLSGNQLLPSLVGLTNDVVGVLLVLAFSGECELVLGLAIWDFVDTEPLVGSP